jgi:hypothetical protein
MITLNTIIKRFEDFADNHFFIRSFSFGSPEDVDLQKFDSYPLMHVVYTGATYEDTTKTLDFEVYIFDLPSHYESKTERQKEIVSDAEQCAEDILADIANGGNIFIFSEDYEVVNATVTPLQEAGSNVLAGVLLELGIQLPYDRSACDAPIDGVQPEGGGFVYARRGLLRMLTQDGTVDVLSVNTIKVANGTLTDEGNGVVSLTTGGGAGGSLEDLDDVTITDPLDHDALIYDEVSAEWINGAPRALDMAVFNGSGSVIAKGKLLKAIGSHGDKVSVGLFDLDVDSPMYLVGLADKQLAIGGTGHARTYGELRGINTNAYAIGTILYASGTAGELSSTAGVPAIPVATVTRSQQNTGRLYVRTWTPGNEEPAFSTFAVSGQSNVVANDTRATATLVGANGTTITTNAATDTITFTSRTLDENDVTITEPRTIDVNGEGLYIQDNTTGYSAASFGSGVQALYDDVRIISNTGSSALLKFQEPNFPINFIALRAPSSFTGDTTYTLPVDGSSAQVLQTNGAGTLSWSTRNAFSNVAVAGQTTVAADSASDTLTLFAGTNITITTDASTDSVTISASGGGGGGSSYSVVENFSSTAYTLVLADAGKYKRYTNTVATTVTVPPQSSVTWVADTEIYFEQSNTGQITIAAGSGVTVVSSETLKTFARYSVIALKRTAENEWTLTGERALV